MKTQFPIISTKVKNLTETFDLNTITGRKKYFEAKVGKEIEEIKNYLDNKTFIAFMLAKKSAGKGTYSKMLIELLGEHRIEQISVGDLVRKTHQIIESNTDELHDLYEYLKTNYRGFVSSEAALKSILERSSDKISIPTELVLSLIKREINKNPNKAFLIDGFPRATDQIAYSLFFREIMNLRYDPDFFVVIDVPDSIIDERIKYRRICPICNTPRNYKLLPTETIEYDTNSNVFHLVCDNPACEGFKKTRMVRKEGDEAGIEPLRQRLDTDGELIERALELHGVPCVKVRNHIPVEEVHQFDHYEITPEYSYSYDKGSGKVIVKESPWIIEDNDGVKCHSLLAAAAVISLIKQIHKVLV